MNCWLFLALALVIPVSSHVIPVGVTVGLTPYSHPIQTLYHAQDNFGQYVYGYATPTSAKTETKTADGVTTGGYSYIDSNGQLQTVQYTASPHHGFRVAATNLPRDLPDVAYARAQHLADYEAVKAEHAQIAAIRAVPYSNPVAVPVHAVPQVPLHQQLPQPVTDLPEVVRARNQHLATLEAAYANAANAALPQPVQDLPEVVKARYEHLSAVEQIKLRDAAINAQVSLSPIPEHVEDGVVPVQVSYSATAAEAFPRAHTGSVYYTPAIYGSPSSQYHSQDGYGQYSYGYVGPWSAKTETRSADGIVRGGYSYIDANGILQTVHYTAGPGGFRVAATNLPVDVNSAVAHSYEVEPAIEHAAAAASVDSSVPLVSQVASKTVLPAQLYNHEIVY